MDRRLYEYLRQLKIAAQDSIQLVTRRISGPKVRDIPA
jgi:hypothetical protein